MASKRTRAPLLHQDLVHRAAPTQVKRKPEQQLENPAKKKRSAFGDITNTPNRIKTQKKETGKVQLKKGGKKAVKGKKTGTTVIATRNSTTSGPTNSQPDKQDISWDIIELSQESRGSSSSQESVKSDTEVEVENLRNLQLSQESSPQKPEKAPWEDVDEENLQDPYQVALYAHGIFEYYKQRELQFLVPDYMSEQTDLSPNMRAILVDWLVEVQENFELNHETLYLAVKLVDHYLGKSPVKKEKLQLVGATALFISCKFDERCPPVLDDFLYICDDAYTRDELIKMEQLVLRTVGFDLGLPLSYRFLRRYSKCARANMETLTLGRYVLEMSLMDYDFVRCKESILGASTLLLALKMQGSAWSDTLVHYTGYTVADLLPLVTKLNAMIAAKPSKQLTTIRTKYSHRVFHEVALIPALADLESSAV